MVLISIFGVAKSSPQFKKQRYFKNDKAVRMCYLDTVKINCEGEVGKNANKKIYIYMCVCVCIYIYIYMDSCKCFVEFPFPRGCLNEHWGGITNGTGKWQRSEENSHFIIKLFLRLWIELLTA